MQTDLDLKKINKDPVQTDCIFAVIVIDRLMDAQTTTHGLLH